MKVKRSDRMSFPHSTYAAVKRDVVDRASVKVDRVALEKDGPRYRGLVDVAGRLSRFTLSGDGFFLQDVPLEEQAQAWIEFQKLEEVDRE